MNRPDQLPPVSNPTTYQASLELVVRQSLTVEDWNNCCADIMVAHAIDNDTIKRELVRRARLLVWMPFLIQIAIILAIYYLYSFVVHPAWFGSIGVEPDIAYLSLSGCFMSQLLYQLWLRLLHKSVSYIPWTTGLTVGIGFQVMFTLCVFLFFIPKLIHNVHWAPIVTTYVWQVFVFVLIVYCFTLPIVMRKTVFELSTTRDQAADAILPKGLFTQAKDWLLNKMGKKRSG